MCVSIFFSNEELISDARAVNVREVSFIDTLREFTTPLIQIKLAIAL